MANKQFKPRRRQREKHRVTKVHIDSKQCQNRAAGLSSAKGTAQQQRRQLREAHSKWRTAKACTKIDLHSVPAAAVAAVAIVVATVVVVVVRQVRQFVVVAVFAPYAFFLSVFQRLRSRFDFLSTLSSHFAACRRVPVAKVIRRTFRIAALATK